MEEYKVEAEFKHKNLKCIVIGFSTGQRCGYVGVPKGHRLYGKDYTDLYDFEEEKGDYIEVHGGLTFSQKSDRPSYPLNDENTWWFGFDTAHYGDAKDMDLVKELNYKTTTKAYQEMERKYPTGGTVRTTQYCIRECENLADQLQEEK